MFFYRFAPSWSRRHTRELVAAGASYLADQVNALARTVKVAGVKL